MRFPPESTPWPITMVLLLGLQVIVQPVVAQGDMEMDVEHPHAESCAWTGGSCEWDYNMQAMRATFENGHADTFYAYVDPDVSTYYNQTEGSRKVVEPKFTGMFGKFVNMGPDTIRIFWDSGNRNEPLMYISDVAPFGSAGTATFPGHVFQVKPQGNDRKVLTTFKISKGESVYVYDPYAGDYGEAYHRLNNKELFQMYMIQHNNNLFATQYKEKTGRDWLALYKQKSPPRYHMWSAESFGQTHTITTKEIFFTEYPPFDELEKGLSMYGPRPDEISRNRRYRDTYPTMNLTLKVISCAPRVFEIDNFLSDLEIEHILSTAQKKGLEESTTKAGTAGKAVKQESSRTSTNTWVGRHESIILDAVYRRAADLLQIDERFLRYRRKLEIPEFTDSSVGIAENLQLVHYDVGQQYTPHHDFSMPGLVRGQPSRFATLLLYLNDDFEGGQTSFPLWRNSETREQLVVTPKKGKAVLFYSLLPDGNYDALSEHASLPVTKGEKWLANLWIWDPVMAHTSE